MVFAADKFHVEFFLTERIFLFVNNDRSTLIFKLSTFTYFVSNKKFEFIPLRYRIQISRSY